MSLRTRRERWLRFLLALVVLIVVIAYLRRFHLTRSPPPEEGAESQAGEIPLHSGQREPVLPPPPVERPPEHKFSPNGLLEVNPQASHPILELIRRAEDGWRAKLRRASKTFPQAVAEYRRRYKRDPPKGFDDWWFYVQRHSVQLPDEYDQIHADLEPFWGINPQDLLAIRAELEAKVDSYTIGKIGDSGQVKVVNTSFAPGKYEQLIKGSVQIIDLLSDVEEFLPSFRAVFSPHDGPNRLSDFFVEDAARKAAAGGNYVRRKDFPKIIPKGWLSACAPGSPGRNDSMNLDGDPPLKPGGKTFIHDHNLAMDPCVHPRHFWQHGHFLSYGKGPTPEREMVPEFSYCSSHVHHNIRIPTPYGWVEDILPRSHDPEWDDKVDERALWRGSNTGIGQSTRTRWRNSHRTTLMRVANELKGAISILSPYKSDKERIGEPIEVRKSRLNPGIMDVAFAGDPLMCDPETCKLLQKMFPWRRRQSVQEAGDYKYVIDVDGNGWSGRFKRLITSNSLVFKSTIYPEWYIDRIAPWVHYIPIQLDLSDLHDALVFFRGDASGVGAHEDLARKIAVEGRVWSKTFWRREDLAAYFLRLMLEYARLMSEDRDAMSYKGDP